jgi:hypothetical protein
MVRTKVKTGLLCRPGFKHHASEDISMRSQLLICDAAVNLLLGLPLMIAPGKTALILGLPLPAAGFYAGILGAVLTGIGIALLLEVFPVRFQITGLGVEGAVCINILGSAALVGWLLFGKLEMPPRGRMFLWGVALLVLFLSGLEFRRYLAGRSIPEVKEP